MHCLHAFRRKMSPGQIVSSDLLLFAWKLDKNWCYRFYCLLPVPIPFLLLMSRLLPFRSVSLCALCFAFGPVRWHCNAYSLFRSCRTDRISHFLLYKLCDWWQSWTTYCVTFEWRKESQICAGKKYICTVVVPADSLNCNYLNKSRHNAIVRLLS